MDNELNKIEYDNNLNSIKDEYHDYNEYNKYNVQNNKYKETTSFKEYNTNKEPLKKRSTAPITIAKLLSSAMVITITVVMGASFIFGPSSVIKDVFISSSENMMFVEVMFSNYSSDDNLELVIKNDFTNRIYKMEAFEEPYEDDKYYMYFEEILDLQENCTYNISIVSGTTTLYKDTYTIPISEDIPHSSVSELYASYDNELIIVSAMFSYFSPDDYVLLQLEKEDQIIESIIIDEVYDNEGNYIYSNSFSAFEEGIYIVKLFVNDVLQESSEVKVENNNIISSVLELGYEYADNVFYYYLDLSSYSENEQININLYLDNNLEASSIINNVFENDNYYSSEGVIEGISEGRYLVVVDVNDEVIYQEEMVLGYIWTTIIDNVDVRNENLMAYLEIAFSEYSSDENILIKVSKDGSDIDNIIVSDVVEDGIYYFNYEFEVTEYGLYECIILIDDNIIYENSFYINKNIANTIVSGVNLYQEANKSLFIVNIDNYDENETISIDINDYIYLDLDVYQDVTGGYFAILVYEEAILADATYKVVADTTATLYEIEASYTDLDLSVTLDMFNDGTSADSGPFIAVIIEENEFEVSCIIYNKNGQSYPQIMQTQEDMEGTRFYHSLDDLEDGEYAFIIVATSSSGSSIEYWYDFSLGNGG